MQIQLILFFIRVIEIYSLIDCIMIFSLLYINN